MKLNLLGLLLGLAMPSMAATKEDQAVGLLQRSITPDNTCGMLAAGNGHGYTCDPFLTLGGPCCSSSGYCGTFPRNKLHGSSDIYKESQ